jgi:hypothetical protein
VFLRSQTDRQAEDCATAFAAGAVGPKLGCPVEITVGPSTSVEYGNSPSVPSKVNRVVNAPLGVILKTLPVLLTPYPLVVP